MRIRVPSSLRRLTGSLTVVEEAGAAMTISELIERIDTRYPGFKQQVCEPDGHVNVFAGGKRPFLSISPVSAVSPAEISPPPSPTTTPSPPAQPNTFSVTALTERGIEKNLAALLGWVDGLSALGRDGAAALRQLCEHPGEEVRPGLAHAHESDDALDDEAEGEDGEQDDRDHDRPARDDETKHQAPPSAR